MIDANSGEDCTSVSASASDNAENIVQSFSAPFAIAADATALTVACANEV